MKLKKLAKKSLSMLLATALAVSGLALDNSSVLNVKAEENTSTPLSVTAFATPEQLMNSDNFALHSDTGSGVAQKVYFGKNGEKPLQWYIAGKDSAQEIDNIVLFSAQGLDTSAFGDINIYAGSTLEATIEGCEYAESSSTSKFTAAEDSLMLSTSLASNQPSDGTAKLYALNSQGYGYDYTYITAGANDDIKIDMSYWGNDIFWLRAPFDKYSDWALVANSNHCVYDVAGQYVYSVVPAFNLDLSSVLFASSAPAATSGASLTDTMTFRVDGAEKLASGAAYTACGVTVNYDEDDGNVFLYVQDADSVYSVEITEDTAVVLSDMTGIDSLIGENTKIWLEKSEDNVAYAVMAEVVLTEHIPKADDGDCTTAITCSICGEVTTEAEAEHIDSNDDGYCDVCDSCAAPELVDGYYQIANAGNLMWFAKFVSNGEKDANAVLLADIDMTGVAWTPICQTVSFHETAATDTGYSGTFDGNGHTISNLTVTGISGGTYSYGLFGTVSGTVKNLGMVNYKYILGDASDARAGSIAGQVLTGGTIINCYSVGHDVDTKESKIAGGIAGCNYGGTISNCYALNGKVTGYTTRWGGVVGDCKKDSTAPDLAQTYGTVSNCYTDDTRVASTQNNSANITDCELQEDTAFASGEVAYLLNGEKTDGTQSWYQTFETDTYPVPDNTHGTVYSIFACDGTTPAGYSNENKNEPHIDENGDEYCDNCGVIYNGIGAYLAGYSVSLNGSIGVNFHMDLTKNVLDDNEAYMLFTLPNGTSQKVMVSDAKAKESTVIEGKTYYMFTCNIAAKEMTDTIQAQLFTSDGSTTQVYEYSVSKYAWYILDGDYDAETKELVKAMLHYGAYSQEWFDYNTTNLANAGLETLDLSEADDWDEFNPLISNNDNVGSFTSAYLTLESDTAINLKFKLADGVSFKDLRVVVQDPMGNVVPVTTDTTENVCLITLTGIKASDLDTTYDFSVTD
ncbi:MAG: hypothetical protein E7292_13945, partial [Lachnospiraceae bacterium]|nr:hypothetical protein [Lachnospiraceae bacterium]